jgi:hypothetical protein
VDTKRTSKGHSRRSLLGRGALLLGGAAGLGAGAVKAADAATSARPGTLTLHGVNWVVKRPERRPGQQLRPGERGTVYGELYDRPGGKRMGSFVGSLVAVEAEGGGTERAGGTIEVHTFRLRDGTLLGMGSTIDGESVFSIVGGTGRYAGARGSYVAQQRLRELGGDGTALITLDLKA